jgi:hypothetical protein
MKRILIGLKPLDTKKFSGEVPIESRIADEIMAALPKKGAVGRWGDVFKQKYGYDNIDGYSVEDYEREYGKYDGTKWIPGTKPRTAPPTPRPMPGATWRPKPLQKKRPKKIRMRVTIKKPVHKDKLGLTRAHPVDDDEV